MKTSACLSKVQYGIYAECVGQEDKPCYNTPYFYILDGSLDAARLCKAVETTVATHPTLFTRIELDSEGEPLQTIQHDETFSLHVEEVTDIEAVKPQLIVPFKIVGDRLFHIRLFRDSQHFYLFIDIHHIINDGTSLKTILSDIDKAYKGEPLEPEILTMADVAAAEAPLRQSPAFEEAKRWYASQFDCSDTYTPLLPDLDSPQQSEAHLLRTLSLDPDRLNAFLKDNGIFKSNFFTSVYAFLLAKYAGGQEALFTTVYNGRTDKRFLHSVGMTVKTLPVYAKFTNDTTVIDFLRQGQEQMSGCRQHDIYSFIDISNDLQLQSNSMFVWHGDLFSDEALCGKPMTTQRLVNSTLDASLYLKAYFLSGRFHVKAEYNSNEYSEALIDQFLESFEAVVEGFLSCQYLRDVSISTTRQIEVLDDFNRNDVDYDATQTIVSLFRSQAQSTPDSVAVVYKDARYTYAQVDDLSNRIAAAISAKGLGEGDVVSVLIPRCEWMAIASLGVLKAGCAYQPLDPSYPRTSHPSLPPTRCPKVPDPTAFSYFSTPLAPPACPRAANSSNPTSSLSAIGISATTPLLPSTVWPPMPVMASMPA